ncbi:MULTISPECIES: ABC transporter substrate-binding protein [unclassified Caballeronia]|uniref:ABC transporter substrate-binding protein n=1 Tax=unclassified Caballeronia TaxID=2646786 RepID=UPI0028635D0E|nr:MULTISPECIES: ABC transporter substrate-binding protein [unclassified Caballeronia]MDR5777178.1 ABC transporter substrate-binding protein [Caballeronia sp. LZ002]MDR5852597.1 ABC transporter substrate-binding protein [Caballeronia sp. LZ003]
MRALLPAVRLAAAAAIACAAGAALAQGATPLRIGALTFLTGRSASYGTLGARGIKLAVDQINANGGVLGRPLFVDLQDTASDSAQAVSLLRRFAASPDVVAVIGTTGTTNEDVIIIPQGRARAFRGVFLGGATLEDPKIVQIVGPAAAPYVVFTPFNANADRPVVKPFVAAYRKAYGNDQIAAYAAYAYDAVMLVSDAVRRVGSVAREKVAQAIGSTHGLHGLTGDYSFSGKGDNTTPQSYIMEVQPNGTFASLN